MALTATMDGDGATGSSERSGRRSDGDLVLDPHDAGEVPTHDGGHVLLREGAGQVPEVAAGLGQALGVRPVRTEEQVVDAELLGEGLDAVLVERADVDVALESLDRVLLEH